MSDILHYWTISGGELAHRSERDAVIAGCAQLVALPWTALEVRRPPATCAIAGHSYGCWNVDTGCRHNIRIEYRPASEPHHAVTERRIHEGKVELERRTSLDWRVVREGKRTERRVIEGEEYRRDVFETVPVVDWRPGAVGVLVLAVTRHEVRWA